VSVPVSPHGPASGTARDDEAIVARIRAGDEETFSGLYLQYHQPLWKFAYGFVRSGEVAEELVQDVFLSIWSRREAWRVETRVGAWLYGAVRNRALNHLRHQRVATAFAPALTAGATMGGPAPDLHDQVEADELEAALTTAVGALSERCRTAMLLRWKHDLTPGEIAEVLGATPGSVRVLLTRARQELAARLGIR